MTRFIRNMFKREQVSLKVYALNGEQQTRYEKGQNITVLVERGEERFAIASGDSMKFYA